MTNEIEFTNEIECTLVRSLARDIDVVAAAKVSTKGPGAITVEEWDGGPGLINYLMKNRHGTPFEHNQMTFFTDAPIFVYRELHRHRIGISINEESGRYKEMRPKFYIPARDRNLTQTGKPGHYIFSPGNPSQCLSMINAQRHSDQVAWNMYQAQLKEGIAREVARMCLPVSIYSSQYYTVNARSLMAILSLRQSHSQLEPHIVGGPEEHNIEWTGEAKFPSSPMKEINILVDKMEVSFAELMPITHKSFVENGYVAP